MKIFLEKKDIGVAIRVELEASEPHAAASQVQHHNRSFYWQDMGCDEWEKSVCSETGRITLTTELNSVWAADSIYFWLEELPKNIGFYVLLEKMAEKEANSETEPLEKHHAYSDIVHFVDGVQAQTAKEVQALLACAERTYDVGQFTIQCGEIHVTDPCYEKDIWCAFSTSAANGTWKAQCTIGPTDWNTRVKTLQAFHESVDPAVFDNLESFVELGNACVDSGQLGFFDKGLFPASKEDTRFEPFYDECCDITCGEHGFKAGIPEGFEFGVVSITGFGDGGYNVYALKNEQGQAIALKAIFIGEENSESEDEESNDALEND